jgi:hypothetical protein
MVVALDMPAVGHASSDILVDPRAQCVGLGVIEA